LSCGNNFDPIRRGYVKSLASPGGNVTGIVSQQTELAAKQVELLTQAFPERTPDWPFSTMAFRPSTADPGASFQAA